MPDRTNRCIAVSVCAIASLAAAISGYALIAKLRLASWNCPLAVRLP
jgi:hypothetical protein